MIEPRQIPLHDFHARHGARFVDFGGWNMPVQYSSILDEHKAVRTAAGLFDVSHMGEFFVQGPDAAAYLDRLVVNRISRSKPGTAVYSPMCAEDGSVVDDLIVYRISANECLVCVNAGNIEKDFAWFEHHAANWQFDISLENQSDHFALLAIQGPLAEDILLDCGLPGVAELKRFQHALLDRNGGPIRVCRTGYTGEDGFEIYLAPQHAEALAAELLQVGEARGLCLCGLGARDSLRLEAGFPLYGHEISEHITPLEAALDWTVKLDKEAFVGKEALAIQKAEGVRRRVIHFKLDGRRIAREGTAVLDDAGSEVGKVLSGTLSPMTGSPIGSALVQVDALASPLAVDLRGHQAALIAARPPLHQ
ncbi:MAG: glycine cleavage system aminomethyltransferase GcvT [Opitutales bacterium]